MPSAALENEPQSFMDTISDQPNSTWWIVGVVVALVASSIVWWRQSGRFGPYDHTIEPKAAEAQSEAHSAELSLLGKERYGEAEKAEGSEAETLYIEAVKYFTKAFVTFPKDILLYSIASGHRELYRITGAGHQRRTAIHRYEQYLAEDPSGKYAVQAQTYIDELDAN